jgi:hypothetical protein
MAERGGQERGGAEALIRELAQGLPPVHRLFKPWLRALLWLGVCVAICAAILAIEGPGLLMRKLAHGPDEVVELIGAVLTAGLAGLAAFTIAVPGRSAAWGLLPVPSLLLWLGASGWGCWRFETEADGSAGPHPPMICFKFIVMMSIPLSLLLFAMLRRSFSVRPTLTATLAGLAAAAASAALLDLVHPFEVSLPDLAAHAAAVALVVGLNRLLSGRALRPLALIAVALIASQAAQAEGQRPLVLELYTSQGCSSCPPADALLSEYAHDRPDLLPLAFHVSYWNQLGWADPFSSPAFTARERQHAAQLHEDTVYTPELVVEGARAVVGSDRAAVAQAISEAKARETTLAAVSVRRAGPGNISIGIGPGAGSADVLLIGFDSAHTTAIGRGENGGRTLREANIVRSLQTVAHWNGAPIALRRPAPAGERVAVVLEAPGGRVVGAAALR